MRRSTQSTLLATFASLPITDASRLSRRILWFVAALALGLSALSGTTGPVAASQPTAGQSDLFLEEGESYEMEAWVANCQIIPPLPPTLNEAGCVAAVGAYVEFVADDGTMLGACTTTEVLTNGQAARCSIFIPLNTTGQAYLDTGTVDGAFAPQRNPIGFSTPGPGPIDGIVGFPIFVNLPTGGSGQTDQTAQTQPVEQPAGGSGRPLRVVITGTCAEPGSGARRIDIGVYTPQGDPLGLPTALIAESGGGSIDCSPGRSVRLAPRDYRDDPDGWRGNEGGLRGSGDGGGRRWDRRDRPPPGAGLRDGRDRLPGDRPEHRPDAGVDLPVRGIGVDEVIPNDQSSVGRSRSTPRPRRPDRELAASVAASGEARRWSVGIRHRTGPRIRAYRDTTRQGGRSGRNAPRRQA